MVNGKHKGDDYYFEALKQEQKAGDFYENLLKFFIDYDINGFSSYILPITEAKQDMINAGRSVVDKFIIARYEEFKAGVHKWEIEQYKPTEYKDFNSFHLALKGKCEFKEFRRNGKKARGYVLREEYIKIYEDMAKDEDEEPEADEEAI
jgi:hypothetical protein